MWQQLKNLYHFVCSFLANVYYGFPGKKLTVIGVTGTSGKTTTTLMIYQLLKNAGYKVSVLSTVKGVIGAEEYDTGLHVTTPGPAALPRYLNKAVQHGDTHFVLEVSSHALDQHRASFVPFSIGVITSFAHEHLDYHKTVVRYAQAKCKLLHAAKKIAAPIDIFQHPSLFSGKGSVESEEVLKKAIDFRSLQKKMTTFGIDGGDISQKVWQLELQLPGDINTIDGLATAAVGTLLGIDKGVIKKSLAAFAGIPGRFELVKNTRGFEIIIDFAHKPDALEMVLEVARGRITDGGRVIVMYGCASERDTLKRPIMGKISGRLADITVLTDEDPRHEEPMKILNEIAQGCLRVNAIEKKIEDNNMNTQNNHHVFFKIPNRSDAIDFIINNIARKGDVILLCGKGHEQSMNYMGKELPWNEHEAVEKALMKGKRNV